MVVHVRGGGKVHDVQRRPGDQNTPIHMSSLTSLTHDEFTCVLDALVAYGVASAT